MTDDSSCQTKKCPNCGAEAKLVNPQHDIWLCTESGTIWEKKPCMYGCFFGSDSSHTTKIYKEEVD